MTDSEPLGTVALPETRQLDVLAGLLERRNVRVLRCPLVAILDSPNQDAVVAWLRRLIESPPELLVFYTGEGIYRLSAAAQRSGLHEAFVAALANTAILTRGPKPVRALKTLALTAQHAAASPTTEGIIKTLDALAIDAKRIGVQYYGGEENAELAGYLRSRDVEVDAVMPYVYASQSDDEAVEKLIRELSGVQIDAIAFTSKAQVARLFAVAERAGLERSLTQAMQNCLVAAIGPVVADELRLRGCKVDVMPDSSWFMKPLVTVMVDRLSAS